MHLPGGLPGEGTVGAETGAGREPAEARIATQCGWDGIRHGMYIPDVKPRVEPRLQPRPHGKRRAHFAVEEPRSGEAGSPLQARLAGTPGKSCGGARAGVP